MKVLQNTPWAAISPIPPTLVIRETDPEWSAAYERWVNGKSPTDDPAWGKRGENVYLHFE